MNGYQAINNYESLSVLTGKMREASMQGNWDKLIGLEQQCSQHIEAMKPVDAVVTLDEAARQRKIHLIKRIMADDAEIRNRTEGWMEQLQNIMSSNHQEQRLQHAYTIRY